MSGCRIQNIKPPCGYRLEGIAEIRLLDYEDFEYLGFSGGGLYDNCLVSGIAYSGGFITLETPETAFYESSMQGGLYTHTLETFINELSSEVSAQLHLAANRRYLVLFKTNAGRWFIFGYEAGANVMYANQTIEGTGALVTLTAPSVYPLFEYIRSDAICTWLDFINIWESREPEIKCQWGNFINIWELSCINDYNHDYSRDYNCTSPDGQTYLRVSPASLLIEPEPPNGVESRVKSNNEWEIY